MAAQVYGCIECGTLFAGWEFCLAHIEHCRPQHYLEVNKHTLKEMCMIGHERCAVPSYQPAVRIQQEKRQPQQNYNRYNDYYEGNASGGGGGGGGGDGRRNLNLVLNNDSNSDCDDLDEFDMNASDIQNCISSSSSDDYDSVGGTTLTQDFLNPVEGTLHHVATVLVREQEKNAKETQRQQLPVIQDSRNINSGSSSNNNNNNNNNTDNANVNHRNTNKNNQRQDNTSHIDSQDQMIMQLLGKEERPLSWLSTQLKLEPSTRPPRPVSTPRNADDDDFISNSRSPNKVDKMKRLQRIERCLQRLIHDASPISADQPKMVLLEMLPKVYEVQYGTKLDYQELGFASLKSLLNAIPSVSVVKNSPYFGLEHEYIRFSNGDKASIVTINEDDSDDESQPVMINDRYRPRTGNEAGPATTSKKVKARNSNSSNNSEEESFSNQRTPQHANSQDKPFSFNSNNSETSFTGSSTKSSTNQQLERGASQDESFSGATLSSCGSSRSMINALAEMLPNTNAYGNIIRVLARHPRGIKIGPLMQQAPEFKNFLSHCTDRRCEAQIKLAQSILQQCQGISYKQTADGHILYFQAPPPSQQNQKPLSIVTDSNNNTPRGPTKTGSTMSDLEEKAARLFAESEFLTPNVSPIYKDSITSSGELTTGPRHPSDDIFRDTSQLETIASQVPMTPKGARTVSPLVARPPSRTNSWGANSPSTTTPRNKQRSEAPTPRARTQCPATPSREQLIAENAAKILAQAQYLTSPQHKSHDGAAQSPLALQRSQTFADDVHKMPQHSQQKEPVAPTRTHASRNPKYRGDSRLYFFTDEMSSSPGEASNVSIDRAASSITVESTSSNDDQHRERRDLSMKVSTTEDTNTVKSDEKGQKAKSIKGFHTTIKENSTVESVIEEIATDLFPSTDMHYKLLVALAEHPNGMTWKDIDDFIPDFAPFVEKHASEKNLRGLKPTSVLQACIGIARKNDGKSDLFFINAPKMRPHRSMKDDEVESVTSDMTEESSTRDFSSGYQQPLALLFTFKGSDVRAAMHFLLMLKRYFQGRPWPTTKGQVKQFLTRLEETVKIQSSSSIPEMQSFLAWLASLVESDTPVETNRRPRKAIQILMDQLQLLKCVKYSGPNLHWEKKIINCVLQNTGAPPSQSNFDHGLGSSPILSVETTEQLKLAKHTDPFKKKKSDCNERSSVTFMCEGSKEQLYVILVGTESVTYIFDCIKLGSKAVCDILSDLLADESAIKTFHNVHYFAGALATFGGIHQPPKGVLDTQIAMEYVTGNPCMNFDKMLRQVGILPLPSNHPIKEGLADGSYSVFRQRPFPQGVLSYAADQIDLLTAAKKNLFEILQKNDQTKEVWQTIQNASDYRAAMAMENKGKRQICFDKKKGNAIASYELLRTHRPSDMLAATPVSVSHSDVSSLLSLLPEDLAQGLSERRAANELKYIVLDYGKPALAWIGDHKVRLGAKGRLVKVSDISRIVCKVDGRLKTDNKVGLENQLHCICPIRNRNEDIVGLNMRVGRHVSGAADMISDLLFSDPTKSILFIGESGSGRSTILREVARLLAEHTTVSIIDTNSEIAGCNNSPHPSVGMARCCAVEKASEQSNVIMHYARSQRPDVMVIDELEQSSDVEAALICKRRSIRLIASTAVGNVRELIADPTISGLLGGVKGEGHQLFRLAEPIFDIVVELRRGAFNEWRIIEDSAEAVDSVLEGTKYLAQLRTRKPTTGVVYLEHERL